MGSIRIELQGVSKDFELSKKDKGALESLTSWLRRDLVSSSFAVLSDISLRVGEGEILGVIGKNGSGKSTLLRIMAGIYEADRGKVKVKGEIVYLTGFTNGLKEKLTMRENIFLVGSIMGLSQESIRNRFDDIVAFSGLDEYLDVKLFKFSSGMQTRVASSIGLHCISHRNPDVLLVDEVIGAGADIDYKEKALNKMEDLLGRGAAVVLVSHDLESIKNYCNQVIWIDRGRVVREGKPEIVVEEYAKSMRA